MPKFCRVRKARLTVAALALAALAAPAVASDEHHHEVVIKGGRFSPAAQTIGVGETLTWLHADGGAPHSVSADDGSFDSSPSCQEDGSGDCLAKGQTFEHTFTKTGRYPYRSRPSGATGVVTVVEED